MQITRIRGILGWRLLSVMFLSYVIFFTYVSFLKFDSFSYKDADLAMFVQVFHNTCYGNFLPASYGNSVVLSGAHFPFIVFLLLPVYACFKSPYTLLFLQALFLGAGAFAVYLIAKSVLGRGFALYFAFSYLIYPALNYVNLYEAHFIAFSLPLLLFMFYFFHQRKFILFVLFMILSLLCQEDVVLVIAGLGVYALFDFFRNKNGRGLKWVLAPFLASLVWGVGFLLLMRFVHQYSPLFKSMNSGSRNGLSYMGFYSWLGKSPGEMAGALFTNPVYVLKNIITAQKIRYIFDLFYPLMFLPVFGASVLVIVFFGMSETLLSNWPMHNNIYFQHSALIIPFIFVSAIFGLKRLMAVRLFSVNRKAVLLILLCVSLICALCLGPFSRIFSDIRMLRKDKISQSSLIKKYFINRVGVKAPLITTFELSSHLARREFMSFFYMFTYDELSKLIPSVKEKYECALIDFNDPMTFYTFFYSRPDNLKERCFVLGKDWGLTETIDSIALFKKGHKSDFKIIESSGFLTQQDKEKIKEASDVLVLAAGCKEAKIDNFPVFEVECSVAKLRENSRNYLPIARITDSQGAYFDRPLIASFRIFPYNEWRENEIVKIREKLSVPAGFQGPAVNLSIYFAQVEPYQS